MNLPERERLALTAIEDRLRRDDPRFAATIAALSEALVTPFAGLSRPRRSPWKGIAALLATVGTALALALTTPHGSAACTARTAKTPATASVQDPGQAPIDSRQDRYEADHTPGC